jgi:hypothetical protein
MTSTRAPLEIAAFDFIGTDRRVGTTFAGGAMQVSLRDSTASPAGLSGLDRFGRLRDLHYRNSQLIAGATVGQTLYRAEYTFDIAGNRLSSNTTRVASSGLALTNFKSQSHSYDALDRLIGSRVGSLDASGTVPTSEAFRDDAWVLDALGNPNGRELGTLGNGSVGFVQPGRTTSGDLDAFGTPWAAVLATPGDAADDASQTTFQTDRRNRFTGISRTTDLPGGAGGIGTTAPFSSIEPSYDAAGNCTFDGSYFYQYDAWNRLVQINAPTQGQWLPEGAAAMVASSAGVNPAPLVPGALVKHFTYDALGRLIRTQSPWPNPSEPDGTVRTERFYYDGIRRIQEVVIDPVRIIDLEGSGAGDAGDGNEVPPQLQQLANQHGGDGSAAAIAGQGQSPTNIDGSSSTTSFENAQTNAGGGTTGSSNITGGNIGGIELSNATLAREYIWGPGGSFVGASVDELLVQIDGQGVNAQAGWVMQDAGGDVVALAVNTTGSGSATVAATGMLASASGTGSGISFRVAAQQEYDAYGQVIWAEHLLNHAALHVGHKGLFVDRLDIGVGNGIGSGGNGNTGAAACAKTFGEPPRIVPLAFNLAQNRNRVLHMSWGRYLQQDPNESGVAVLASQAFSASSMEPSVYGVRLLGQYKDGSNLYEYVQGQPTRRGDPMGLYSWEDAGQDAMDIMGLMDPIPGPGDYIRGALKGMVQEYAARQEWDVDWASDWSMSDDMHSRNDSSWVEIAALEGVKEEFTVELPFTDYSVNPLDTGIDALAGFASGGGGGSGGYAPGKGPGVPIARGKAPQQHHIASNKGHRTKDFEKLFATAGKNLEWHENRMDVPHEGRHPKEYSEFVYKRLNQAVSSLKGPEAEAALTAELRKMRTFIAKNPDFLYDNAGKKPTGWRGMRELYGKPHLRGRRGRR